MTHNPGGKNTTYSPMWLANNLELPKDRATINAWCRSFYALDPDVNRIIGQQSLLPLKYLSYQWTDNNEVDNLFKEMNSCLGLPALFESIMAEYLVLGEVFIYAEINPTYTMWSRLMIQNPDYIIVKRSTISSDNEIFLRPDENLRRIVNSSKPEDREAVRQLNQNTIEDIKANRNIKLDSFQVSHMVRKISPYEIRGTGVLNSLLRILQKPNRSDEETATLKATLGDLDYQGNEIVKDVMLQRSLQYFDILSNWVNNKIYAPVAKMNQFYSYKEGKKAPLYPTVNFNTLQLQKDLKA